MPERIARDGDPWADLAAQPQSLLELDGRDRSGGLPDAPWAPVYPKMPDEPPRVAPSRARRTPTNPQHEP